MSDKEMAIESNDANDNEKAPDIPLFPSPAHRDPPPPTAVKGDNVKGRDETPKQDDAFNKDFDTIMKENKATIQEVKTETETLPMKFDDFYSRYKRYKDDNDFPKEATFVQDIAALPIEERKEYAFELATSYISEMFYTTRGRNLDSQNVTQTTFVGWCNTIRRQMKDALDKQNVEVKLWNGTDSKFSLESLLKSFRKNFIKKTKMSRSQKKKMAWTICDAAIIQQANWALPTDKISYINKLHNSLLLNLALNSGTRGMEAVDIQMSDIEITVRDGMDLEAIIGAKKTKGDGQYSNARRYISTSAVQKLQFEVPLQLVVVLLTRGNLYAKKFADTVKVVSLDHFFMLIGGGWVTFVGQGDKYLFAKIEDARGGNKNRVFVDKFANTTRAIRSDSAGGRLSKMYENAGYPKAGFYVWRFSMGNTLRIARVSEIQRGALFHESHGDVGFTHYSHGTANIPVSALMLRHFEDREAKEDFEKKMRSAGRMCSELESRAIITVQAQKAGRMPGVDNMQLARDQEAAMEADGKCKQAKQVVDDALASGASDQQVKDASYKYRQAKGIVSKRVKREHLRRLGEKLKNMVGGSIEERKQLMSEVIFTNTVANEDIDLVDVNIDNGEDAENSDSDEELEDENDKDDNEPNRATVQAAIRDEEDAKMARGQVDNENDLLYAALAGYSDSAEASRIAMMSYHYSRVVGEIYAEEFVAAMLITHCCFCNPSKIKGGTGSFSRLDEARKHLRDKHPADYKELIHNRPPKFQMNMIIDQTNIHHQLV